MSIADILNYASTMPAWMEDASCANSDMELWFSSNPYEITKAKSVCNKCPVREQCLKYAMDTNERHGVWGALSAEQRIRRANRAKKDAA